MPRNTTDSKPQLSVRARQYRGEAARGLGFGLGLGLLGLGFGFGRLLGLGCWAWLLGLGRGNSESAAEFGPEEAGTVFVIIWRG